MGSATTTNGTVIGGVGGGRGSTTATMSERFDEEWFWVFASGIAAVVVVAANLLLLVSICRNRFLVGANTHRAFALLAVRNLVRACFGLAVLYTARWQYATRMFRKSTVIILPLFKTV